MLVPSFPITQPPHKIEEENPHNLPVILPNKKFISFQRKLATISLYPVQIIVDLFCFKGE